MNREGPQLERLLRRLVDCPPEFWETCAGPGGLATVDGDCLRSLPGDGLARLISESDPTSSKPFAQQSANLSALAAVACWLFTTNGFAKETSWPHACGACSARNDCGNWRGW